MDFVMRLSSFCLSLFQIFYKHNPYVLDLNGLFATFPLIGEFKSIIARRRSQWFSFFVKIMSQWTHKLTFTTALFCILGNKIIIVISGHFRPLELLGAILLSYLRNTVLNLGKRKDQLRTNQPFYFNFIAEKNCQRDFAWQQWRQRLKWSTIIDKILLPDWSSSFPRIPGAATRTERDVSLAKQK